MKVAVAAKRGFICKIANAEVFFKSQE